MFFDRKEAGELLYKELLQYTDDKDAVVVTLPRGGVSVAYPIAEKLNLPLELTLSKKIGHPFNKEYAIGAVTVDSKILDPSAIEEVPTVYINDEVERLRKFLKKRFELYYGSRTPMSLKDKTVIIVDDGVATGNTLISSIQLIQQQSPREIIVALPVAPASAIRKIKALTGVDNIHCLEVPAYFQSVGQYYADFSEVSDEEVIRLLKMAHDKYDLTASGTHS